MALVAAALGTGKLPTPHFTKDYVFNTKDVGVSLKNRKIVLEGMRKVVAGGTGQLAGKSVEANVIGKTGTAEVGSRANRRKNTWFIGYVTPTDKSIIKEPLALALVVENGESGGSTSAPKVGEILRAFYGESEK
jgi:cell division protein FtsI/penicillin-binding protein 2